MIPSFLLDTLWIVLPLGLVAIGGYLGRATLRGLRESFFSPVTIPLKALEAKVDSLTNDVSLVKQDTNSNKLLAFDLRERVQQGAVELENLRSEVSNRFWNRLKKDQGV